MGGEAPLVVELHPVLHEPELLLVGGEHLVLHLTEQVGGEAVLEGEGTLGQTDGEVWPARLALPDAPGHPLQAVAELLGVLAPGRACDRPEGGLALLWSDAF